MTDPNPQYDSSFIEVMNFPQLKRLHIRILSGEAVREDVEELIKRIKVPGVCPSIESIAMSSDARKFEYIFETAVMMELPADLRFDREWAEWKLGMSF